MLLDNFEKGDGHKELGAHKTSENTLNSLKWGKGSSIKKKTIKKLHALTSTAGPITRNKFQWFAIRHKEK